MNNVLPQPTTKPSSPRVSYANHLSAHNPYPSRRASWWDMWLVGLLFGTALGGGLCIVMAIPLYYQVASRPFSIALRAIVLFLASIVICRTTPGIGTLYKGRLWVPLGIFWALYLSFTAYYCLYSPQKLPYEVWVFCAYLWGATVIPMLAFFKNFDFKVLKGAFYGLFGFLWVQCFLCSSLYKTFIGTNFIRLGSQLDHQAIQPLALGYSGSALILLSTFLCISKNKQSLAKWGFAVSGLIFGGICLVLSASRGPFASTVLMMALYLSVELIRFKNFKALVALGLIVLAIPSWISFVEFSGSAQIQRIVHTFDQLNSGSIDRFVIWTTSGESFFDHLLGGGSIVVPGTDSYAHNIIIEAFSVTGLLGGICMLILSIYYVFCMLHILWKFPGYSWIALLAGNFFVCFNVTGSTAGALGFFASLGLLCNSWKWGQPLPKRFYEMH